MRQAFSIDSLMELDLSTLAETMASCRLKQKGRRCGKDDCGRCDTQARLSSCMEQLSDCDTLRVRNMAQEIYSAREFQLGLDRPSAKEAFGEWAEVALAGAAAFVGGLLFLGAGSLFMFCVIRIFG